MESLKRKIGQWGQHTECSRISMYQAICGRKPHVIFLCGTHCTSFVHIPNEKHSKVIERDVHNTI